MSKNCVQSINVAAFRHQLWLEHIELLDEFVYDNSVIFVLKTDYICPSSMLNLLKVYKFGVSLLYYEGNKRLHLHLWVSD